MLGAPWGAGALTAPDMVFPQPCWGGQGSSAPCREILQSVQRGCWGRQGATPVQGAAVELLVPLEGGRTGESVGVGAGEGWLASVRAAVVGEAGGLDKGHAAVRALVGPLSRVQRPVLQVG